MAVCTASGCALHLTVDVAVLAVGLDVETIQGKAGVIVIEGALGLGAELGNQPRDHQQYSSAQKKLPARNVQCQWAEFHNV